MRPPAGQQAGQPVVGVAAGSATGKQEGRATAVNRNQEGLAVNHGRAAGDAHNARNGSGQHVFDRRAGE
jgi:hypothetical protein